jgi:butyryl-CoA dehydrogenase
MRGTVDFLLHGWLKVEALCSRERFAEHSRETFAAVLDTCERIAREKYAPFNRLVDTEEPRVVSDDGGDRVVLPQATHGAWKAYAESGMLAAAQDAEIGGMQLPYMVEAAANAFFAKASVSIGAGMLTVGNANLLMAHGTPLQRQVFALNQFSGRWAGTMCLSEPQAGSSLSDVATRALPDGPDHDRRARADREHRAPGAGQDPGPGRPVGARHPRHFAVHRAEEAGRHRRPPHRRAQRRGAGRLEPQMRLARHEQYAAEFW